VILNLALRAGIKIVTMPRFDLPEFLRLIQEQKVTQLHIVPPIVLALAKHPLVAKFDLSSVKMIYSAAAPLAGSIQTEILAKFPWLKIKQAYGLTEASPAITMVPDAEIKAGSVGILLPNIEAKVIDPITGNTIDPSQDGELCFRGPNIMKGYLNKAEATASTIKDGFLHSGDIGHFDQSFHVFIVDRAKELIKYKGMQVAPAELEGLLTTHPAIADAAVIGIPNEEAGEIPKAFVVLKANQEVAPQDLQTWLDNQVAPHKKLRGGLEIVKEIPRSLSGKILRRELKAMELAKQEIKQ
jgi:acyl-CoA synthetase (AMP-forming)/AMP-acid ligase II